MKKENKSKVVEANLIAKRLHQKVMLLHDELEALATPFSSKSGFVGDSILTSAADYLLGAIAMLESAFCGFSAKAEELELIIRKNDEDNDATEEDKMKRRLEKNLKKPH